MQIIPRKIVQIVLLKKKHCKKRPHRVRSLRYLRFRALSEYLRCSSDLPLFVSPYRELTPRAIMVVTLPLSRVPITRAPLYLRHDSGFGNGREYIGQLASLYTQCQQILSRLAVSSTDHCRNLLTARGFEISSSGYRHRSKRISATVRQRYPRLIESSPGDPSWFA